LDAAVSSGYFMIFSGLSFNLLATLFSVSFALNTPTLPPLPTTIYLTFILPILAFSMAFSAGDDKQMKRCPHKNEEKVVFYGRRGKEMEIKNMFARCFFVALGGFILQMIAFGQLVLGEGGATASACNINNPNDWWKAVRCEELIDYNGEARSSAGTLAVVQCALCSIACSASFLFRRNKVNEMTWRRNRIWAACCVVMAGVSVVIMIFEVEARKLRGLNWLFWVLFGLWPALSLKVSEVLKVGEIALFERGVLLRRLQFETKLGMHSPVPTLKRERSSNH